MIFFQKPADFKPIFEVVSCFCEHEGKILLLLRQDHSLQGNTWGTPAGKMEAGESITEAMLREIKEETGFTPKEDQFDFNDTLYVRYDDYDFVYHMFSAPLRDQIEVVINKKEHKDFCWVTPQEALQLPLVKDMDACVKLLFQIK